MLISLISSLKVGDNSDPNTPPSSISKIENVYYYYFFCFKITKLLLDRFHNPSPHFQFLLPYAIMFTECFSMYFSSLLTLSSELKVSAIY